MPTISNLPGVFPELQDNNLAVLDSLSAPVVLVIGTSDKGPSEFVIPVRRDDNIRSLFGYNGTLGRGLLEAKKAGAKSVVGYRIGATAASLALIGGNPGITVTTITKDNEAGESVEISWDNDAGILQIWDAVSGTLIFSNDPSNLVDLGQVIVEGETGGAGGSGSFGVGAPLTMSEADSVLGDTNLVYTAGTDGTTLTYRQLFEALQDAYRALDTAEIRYVVAKGTYLDVPNIADDLTLIGGGLDFLGWFKEEEDVATGLWTKYWSDAAVKPDGYHEVSFYHQMANFCHQMTKNKISLTGAIGVLRPASFSTASKSQWVGKLPTYSLTGAVPSNGLGLLGNKFLAGKVAVPGVCIGGGPGIFVTSDEFLDGTVEEDRGGSSITLSKYVDVVGSWPTLYNESDTTGLGYIASGDATYIGFYSTLPSPEIASTNKVLPMRLSLAWRLNRTKLDALAGVGVTMLDSDKRGIYVVDAPLPYAAYSDYKRQTTTAIVFDLIEGIRDIFNSGFGGGGLSPIKLEAFKTELEIFIQSKVGTSLQDVPNYDLTSTPRQQILGEAELFLDIWPSFEWRRMALVISLKQKTAATV